MLRRITTMTFVRLIAVFMAVSVVGMGLGCSTNPATGQRQLNFLSESREIALGEENAPVVLKELGGVIPSKTIENHVSEIGLKLARLSERPELPWEFFVADSEVVNAFALPGGKIFITRGLISKMENDAQLAAVLGHEIAHVTAQHSGQQMAHGTIVSILATGASVAADSVIEDEMLATAVGVGSRLAGTGLVLQYSRSHESQADSLGLRYMTQAGYNPEGMVQLMEILQREAQGGFVPEFMLTHPLPQTRIRQVQNKINRDYPDHNQPGRYRWGVDSFRAYVRTPLESLPKPKGERQQQTEAS